MSALFYTGGDPSRVSWAVRHSLLYLYFFGVRRQSFMTPIHATVLSAERFRDQYRLIIQLVPSEFLGPFERLRFKKNPYCGSFGTSVDKSWVTLDYRKDPGFKAGEAFPLWRTN